MTTGAAWHIEEDADWEIIKPWAWFDVNDIADIPINWADWLEDKGTTYASHTIICEAGLECTASAEDAGVITMRIQKDALVDLVEFQKYYVTQRIVGADGQRKDRTWYLKIGTA